MARLNSQERNSLPSKDFGLPATRSYPVENASHAANAKARASEMYNKGDLSGSQKAQIDRKADAKLHPRDHALTLASATHLHNKGLISTEHHAAIRKHAEKRLAVHKASKPTAYGSMAPQSAGHYAPVAGAAMDEPGGWAGA